MLSCVYATCASSALDGRARLAGGQPPARRCLPDTFARRLPNRNGAASLYGYVSNVAPQDDGSVLPGSELYYDNVSVTPNKK